MIMDGIRDLYSRWVNKGRELGIREFHGVTEELSRTGLSTRYPLFRDGSASSAGSLAVRPAFCCVAEIPWYQST